MKIIITSVAIALLILYSVYWFVILLHNKIAKKKTSSLPFFGLLLTIFGLIVYDIILIFGLMATNNEKITPSGNTDIPNTVEFTTSAILEGFGKSSDYFENKWESNYIKYFEQVDVKLISSETTTYNEQKNRITLDIEFDNHNVSKNELKLSTLSDNSYILISDGSEIFYPLEFDFEQPADRIPTGKTSFIVKGLVPLDFTPATIKIGNRRTRI